MFLNDMGISPFIGLYNEECPVFGAIAGGKTELLNFFVDKCRTKYIFSNESLKKPFIEHCDNKCDTFNNNALHYAFALNDVETRNSCVRILLNNNVG